MLTCNCVGSLPLIIFVDLCFSCFSFYHGFSLSNSKETNQWKESENINGIILFSLRILFLFIISIEFLVRSKSIIEIFSWEIFVCVAKRCMKRPRFRAYNWSKKFHSFCGEMRNRESLLLLLLAFVATLKFSVLVRLRKYSFLTTTITTKTRTKSNSLTRQVIVITRRSDSQSYESQKRLFNSINIEEGKKSKKIK